MIAQAKPFWCAFRVYINQMSVDWSEYPWYIPDDGKNQEKKEGSGKKLLMSGELLKRSRLGLV